MINTGVFVKHNNNNFIDKIMCVVIALSMISIFGFPDKIIFSYISRVLLVFSFFIFCFKKNSNLNANYFIWASVFSFVGFLSSICAYDTSISFNTYLITLQAIWLGVMISHWLKTNQDYYRLFHYIVLGALIQCVRLFNYIDFSSWGHRKVSTMLGVNVNSIGLRLAIAFAFCVLYAIYSNNHKRKILYYFFCICIAAFILITGSRRAFLLMLLVYVIIYLMSSDKIIKKIKSMIIISFVLILLYLILTQIPELNAIIGSRIENFIYSLFGPGTSLDGDRDLMIIKSIELFKQRPILGWGMGSFQFVSGMNHVYSHNTYVELLYTTGIFGFISYYSILIFIFFKYRLFSNNDKIMKIIVVSLTACMLVSDFAAVNFTSLVSQLIISIVISLQNSNNYCDDIK